MSDASPKVLHIITGLEVGGAENMLLRLIEHSDAGALRQRVVSLTGPGTLGPRIAARGVPVDALGMGSLSSLPAALLRARAIVREFEPTLVQTWLHHADLFGALLKMSRPAMPLMWNLRCAELSVAEMPRRNRLLVRGLALLSRMPACVIANSNAGRATHAAAGYRPRHWEIVGNGFDLARFAPDADARTAVRAQWGVATNAPVIGVVGRFHAVKGFASFVAAAARFRALHPDACFVFVGAGLDAGNAGLAGWIDAAGLRPAVRLLGPRDDVARVMNGFDLLASASTTEGFPNVLGEAMACGVPCVATDAGDSARVIGDTGRVVPIGDAGAMADAWHALWTLDAPSFARLRVAARERVASNFGIDAVAAHYQSLYARFGRGNGSRPCAE